MQTTQISDQGSFFIKSYFRGGMVRYLVKNRYLRLGKPRSQIEFEMMKEVQSLGIRVPELVAFAYQDKIFYQCWLITREIFNHQTLADFCKNNLNAAQQIMPIIVGQVVKLIKNKILHVDFHPGNVLIENNHVYFIDFDKARYFSGSEIKLINRYVKRWNRAVLKYDLPLTMMKLFQTGLSSSLGLENKVKNMKMKQKTLPPKPSILIVLMGSLGDLIRGLSLVSNIKNQLPNSKITWLVEPKWKALTDHHPGIDKVVIFKRSRNFLGVWELKRVFKREHFDITLDLQRHFKSGFFSYISQSKRRIGFNPNDSKEFNWIFNNEYIDSAGERVPKIKHYLKFTEYLGLTTPNHLDFGFSKLDFKRLLPDIISNLELSYIAVVLGSSWESKDWTNQGYNKLIKHLLLSHEKGIVLLGDKSQISNAKLLSENLRDKRVINLVGQTSLMELLAVLKTATAAVGPDSGPGHMAAAVSTPYVTLFGPTSPRRAAPYKCENLVVRSNLDCLSCYKKRCPDLESKCMKLIDLEEVLMKVDQAIQIKKIKSVK